MESAFIDGASHFTIFTHLILPLSVFFALQRYFVRGYWLVQSRVNLPWDVSLALRAGKIGAGLSNLLKVRLF